MYKIYDTWEEAEEISSLPEDPNKKTTHKWRVYKHPITGEGAVKYEEGLVTEDQLIEEEGLVTEDQLIEDGWFPNDV